MRQKEVWDLVTDIVNEQRPIANTAPARAKLAKDNATASLIIKKDISDALFQRVESENTPRPVWNSLRDACSQTGQDVVYSLLQEAVQYPAAKKAEGLSNKPVVNDRMSALTSIIDRLLAAVDIGHNVWDDVKLVLLLESLPVEFDARKAYILANQNMTLKTAVTSLASNEVQILRENAIIGEVESSAMLTRSKSRPRSQRERTLTTRQPPMTDSTPISKVECWKCGKTGHYKNECTEKEDTPNVSTNRRSSTKPNKRPRRSGKAHKVIEVDETGSESSDEPLKANMVHESPDISMKDKRWYIDSCASRHMTFQRNLFTSMASVRHDFQTAASHTMASEGTGSIRIKMQGGKEINLDGVSYIPTCASNLLSLSRLKEIGITYHDHDEYMILKQGKEEIAKAKRLRHLYVLDIESIDKVLMTGQGRPNFLEAKTEAEQLWHRRLAHASHKRIDNLTKLVDGMKMSKTTKNYTTVPLDTQLHAESNPVESSMLTTTRPICEPCVVSKQTRIVGHKPMTPTTRRLERVHSDLWGPHDPPSLGGNRYAVVLIDDFTRKTWTIGVQSKDKFFSVFKTWKTAITTETNLRISQLAINAETNLKISKLRVDGGGEYISTLLQEHCEEEGISVEYTAPYTPEHNAISERSWRTLDTMKDAMLADSQLPKEFWGDAMMTATYLKNLLPTASKDSVPEELWTDKRQEVSHLVIFGCLAYVHIPKEKRKKSDQKVWKGIMIGYTATTKQYRIWSCERRCVFARSAVTFDESKSGADLLVDHPLVSRQKSKENTETLTNVKSIGHAPRKRGRPRKDTQSTQADLTAKKTRLEDSEAEYLPDSEEEIVMTMREVNSKVVLPTTYEQAINDPIHGPKWLEAIKVELENHAANGTWVMCDLPKGGKLVGCKWVFVVKYDEHGRIVRYKARLVAQGFTQRHGIDYEETFAPTIRYETLRIFLAFVAYYDWELYQADVVAAYLHGDLDKDTMFMKPPKGLKVEGSREKVCHIIKGLYGLKQSGRVWTRRGLY